MLIWFLFQLLESSDGMNEKEKISSIKIKIKDK